MSLGLFGYLPEDVFRLFWTFLDAQGLCALAQVCKLLGSLADTETLWRAQVVKFLAFNSIMVRAAPRSSLAASSHQSLLSFDQSDENASIDVGEAARTKGEEVALSWAQSRRKELSEVGALVAFVRFFPSMALPWLLL